MKKRNLLIIGFFLALTVLVALVGRTFRNRYRYRYSIAVAPDISRHIALMEERIKKNPDAAIDRAILASYYAAKAKQSGDVSLYDRAGSLARESLHLLPFSNTSAKITLARVAEARHHFREAIVLAHEVEHEGHRVEALGVLITCHLALGELGEAATGANLLVQTKPSLMSYALRGLAEAAQGHDGAAEKNWLSGLWVEDIGETQDSAWVRSLLARHYLKNGRLSEAHLLLEEALRIVPQYHLALDLLGQWELQQGNYAEAARYHTDAFASSKQVVYLRHSARALRLARNEQAAETLRKEAERFLREELSSGEYGHRLELVQLLLDVGRYQDVQEAIPLARAEWDQRPSAETGYVLARALSAAGSWTEARGVIEKVVDSGVKDARYYQARATIERAVGNVAEADRFLSLAARFNPAVQKLMEGQGDGAPEKFWL